MKKILLFLVLGLASLQIWGCNDSSDPSNDIELGPISINGVRISRTECVSPCTVMFSVDRITDRFNTAPFTRSGIRWNYDDDQANEEHGRYHRGSTFHGTGTGASREEDVNTPIGMHTYHCESGVCTFNPRVAVRSPHGEEDSETMTIVVRSQSNAYPGTRTVCISSASNWGGSTPCPAGATQVTSLPTNNSWQSHTRYLFRRGESFGSVCIPYNRENILISNYGSGSTLPEISSIHLGHDGTCSDTIPTNATVASYTVSHWLNNITLENLRTGSILVGMSFRDLEFHDLDMDYESASGGGEIRVVSADACTNVENLTCSNIRTPRGFYVTDTRIIGATGSLETLPGWNISLLNSTCVSFFGVLNVEVRAAFGHNVRLECASRVLAMHSDINGDHLGTNGDKNAITIRPEGYRNADMLDEGIKISNNEGKAAQYDNRYIVAKGLYLGTPASVNNSARITFNATNASQAETTRHGLISASLSNLAGGTGSGPPDQDAFLQGVDMVCYNDNTWSDNQGCRDRGQDSVPNGFYQPAQTNVVPPVLPSTF